MALHTAATTTVEAIHERFRQRFGAEARVFRAPGRVNLIGEHTDYNDGFVMPAAIGLSCWVAAAPRPDRKLVLHSEQFNETFCLDLIAGTPQPAGLWSDYALGVAVLLERAGMPLAGANLLIHSEIPLGGGLSSSAAFEVAIASALMALAGWSTEPARLAQLCRQAEHEYALVRCGIMDQFAALHGAAGHAMLLNCRSLAHELLPLPADLRLVTCNSMVKHALAAGAYNQRRAECEEAVRLLSSRLPGVRALCDLTPEQLEAHREAIPEHNYRRARHVVTENERTLDAAAALREGHLARLGRRMAESHASLRDDYEVSCRELDLMVEIAGRQRGVHGTRMTGGGFGGCVVCLVEAAYAEEFRASVAEEYERACGVRPQAFILEAAAAAGEVALQSGSD